MHAYLGCTACDIPICGSSAPLFPPDGAVFAEPGDVIFALWFPDVSFFFAARAESEVASHVFQKFRCLIFPGEYVLSLMRAPVANLHHNLVGFHQYQTDFFTPR